MAVREYIGARYIPVFADPIQWDPTNVYEPLTVVTNEGASYVSRRMVPEGIQLNNTDYWVLWADFNAQLQHYIDEVNTFDGRIDNVEDALPVADFSSVNTVSSAISSLDGRLDDIEAALPIADFSSADTVADEIEKINDTAIFRNHTNLNSYLNIEHIQTVAVAGETYQSMCAYNGYLYIMSYDASNNVIIRKYNTDFDLIASYNPTVKAHGNSMAIHNEKIYLTGVYHDGADDYGQVAVYNISNNTSSVLDFSGFNAIYSLQVFTSNNGVSFFGMTESGVFFQMLHTSVNDVLTPNWTFSVPEVNGISQDSMFVNGVYYQLIGSRYNNNNATANCMLGYRYNGELVNCTTFIQDETGNAYPYNELEGIAFLDNKLYLLSMRGLVYRADYYPIQLPDNNSITRYKPGIMTIFGAGNKRVKDGKLTTKIYCTNNFTMTNLTNIIGTAVVGGHTVNVAYNVSTQELTVDMTSSYHASATYAVSWHIVYERKSESGTYIFELKEIWLGTGYGGSWTTYYGWSAITTAGYGNKDIDINELSAIYEASPSFYIDLS